MPIDPIKIPQNVYVEDRIIGPLTLKQILMMTVGCGFSYMLYTTMAKANGGGLSLPVIILCWIPGAISATFALVKINDLSLFRICLLVLEHMNKPPRRVWQQRQGLTIHIRTSEQEEINEAKKKVEQQKLLAKAQQTKSRIEELSNVLDHPIATPDPTENTAIDASAAGESPAQTETSDPAPRFPVDPGKIAVDQPKKKDDQDGLSAYDGVFRDISPNP